MGLKDPGFCSANMDQEQSELPGGSLDLQIDGMLKALFNLKVPFENGTRVLSSLVDAYFIRSWPTNLDVKHSFCPNFLLSS